MFASITIISITDLKLYTWRSRKSKNI